MVLTPLGAQVTILGAKTDSEGYDDSESENPRGPARLLRASRLDLGCLEVSEGPARPLRASGLDLGCPEVSG